MNTELKTVTSKDGSGIAFEQSGTGRPVVLVGAALADAFPWQAATILRF